MLDGLGGARLVGADLRSGRLPPAKQAFSMWHPALGSSTSRKKSRQSFGSLSKIGTNSRLVVEKRRAGGVSAPTGTALRATPSGRHDRAPRGVASPLCS